MEIRVSPSLMCADLLRLGDEIEALEKAGADMFHLDVMDGHFVPNFVFGEDMVKAVRRGTDLPLDVHLWIYNPEKHIARFAEAGASVITVHKETCEDVRSVIHAIGESGASPCVAVNPETPISEIEDILSEVSMVDIVGIGRAFAGQELAPGTIDKIKTLKELAKKKNLHLNIEIDGGVNRETVPSIVGAGANVVIVGGQMLFHKERKEYKKVIDYLKGLQCG